MRKKGSWIGGETPLVLHAGTPLLGSRARWGSVGYAGDGFAPTPGTYLAVSSLKLGYSTEQDSGITPYGRDLLNLLPLIAAALYDAGFAFEAGPLATWSN